MITQFKKCNLCKIELPVSKFSYESKEHGTYKSRCNECLKNIRQKKTKEVVEKYSDKDKLEKETQECNTCHEVKKLTDFVRNCANANGFKKKM